jgi:hypothetical protein
MGEAKRKARLNARISDLPADIKNDIAAVARAPTYITGGGTCAFRAYTGWFALKLAGIEAQRVSAA